MNKKELALRIKGLREDRHLHQKEVAAVLGISQTDYCDRENGHTAFTAVELDKLAEFHGKTLAELLHADRSVLHMNDHASHGYIENVSHAQTFNGVSEEVMKQFVDGLAANARALERVTELQAKMLDLLSKHQ
jgi:transcriptional regulator with XRE-family HTH domain